MGSLIAAVILLLRSSLSYAGDDVPQQSCDCLSSDDMDKTWRSLLGYLRVLRPASPHDHGGWVYRAPLCGLDANAHGRFSFEFRTLWRSLDCPAGAAAEALVCMLAASEWSTRRNIQQDSALAFLDAAFEHIAIAGSACFAASRWGRGLGLDLDVLLSIHAEILRGITTAKRGHAQPRFFQASAQEEVPPSRCLELESSADRRGQQLETEASGTGPGWPPRSAAEAAAAVHVSCLVPLVWPVEREFGQAIVRTYGRDCDSLRFFIAGDGHSEAVGSVAGLGSSEVVDLRVAFPEVPRDRAEFHRVSAEKPTHAAANTIAKVLHMLRSVADEVRNRQPSGAKERSRWFCRLERDTYFLPRNFRHFVDRHNLSSYDPHYLGARQFFEVSRFGLVFNDGGPGVCLSEAALILLGRVLSSARWLLPGAAPDFESCTYAQGHREDLMLAVCLREAGILASSLTTDSRGRDWFGIRPLHAIPGFAPPKGWGHSMHGESMDDGFLEDSFAWNF